MHNVLKLLSNSVLIAAALLAAPRFADACSVPVFRYALDHWTPDRYRLQIVHRGALTGEHSATVQKLQQQVAAQFVNAVVEVVNLDETDDPALAERFGQVDIANVPHLFVQAPTGEQGVYRNVWSGPLAAEAVDAWLSSPIRDQLVKQLLAGTSVVWVYLESGDAAVDDASFALLQTELARLEGELELPEIDPADLKDLSTSPEDVQLKLSALRLSRSNPAEAPLVEMLLSSEPDLREDAFVQEPMAFPIFGRGRILYSLVGKGITAGLIEDACRFLIGACQCTVKAQNPGVDLLLAVDWDGLISPTAPTEVDVTLTGLAGFRSDSAAGTASAIAAADPTAAGLLPEAVPEPAATTDPIAASAATAETADEAPPASEESDDERRHRAVTIRRPEAPPAPFVRPGVVVAILGLLVVVGSFFLIPRQ